VQALKPGYTDRLWQRSFYDHGIRKIENMNELVNYLLQNPVRKHLVAQWSDYVWMGGSHVDEWAHEES
jgi:predicted NAD/FAD-dependent oxidoreductase